MFLLFYAVVDLNKFDPFERKKLVGLLYFLSRTFV